MHGRAAVDVGSPASFGRVGNAIVVLTGFVSGYGATHATIAHFPGSVPDVAEATGHSLRAIFSERPLILDAEQGH
eukprot:GDKH01018724.1.p1 GENE.GDKH01018724.1~~GDKH01018724.1.p1  ORF type:complete len:75 (+),score=13.59 GDKH01018724.1:2-226(+)